MMISNDPNKDPQLTALTPIFYSCASLSVSLVLLATKILATALESLVKSRAHMHPHREWGLQTHRDLTRTRIFALRWSIFHSYMQKGTSDR